MCRHSYICPCKRQLRWVYCLVFGYWFGIAVGAQPASQLSDFDSQAAPAQDYGQAAFVAPLQQQSSSTDEERVSRLEQRAFGATYSEHELDDRVTHLEEEVLKMKGQGPLSERISKIEQKLTGENAFCQTPLVRSGTPMPENHWWAYGTAPPPRPAPTPNWTNNRQFNQQQRPAYGLPPYAMSNTNGTTASAAPGYANAYQSSYSPGYQSRPPDRMAYSNYPTRGIAPNTMPQNNANFKPANIPEMQNIVDAIPFSVEDGDYLSQIRRFPGGSVARWTSFPITIHLPQESPDSWNRSLKSAVLRWSQYLPIQMVSAFENQNIDVQWVNKLPPGYLGITRWESDNGSPKVTIFALRPSFYPADISERTLAPVFLHELGHALGILGHSNNPEDLMASSTEHQGKKATSRSDDISRRDLNTIKHIYNLPALAPGFRFNQPLEYSKDI